jgi:inner membrane protein
MASLLTHPIVPITAAALVGRSVIPLPLLALAIVFALLPDVDSIAFRLGIPYSSPFGHRGFSHSLVVAAACALLVVPFARALHARPITVFAFLFLAIASHGVLDACTNAGHGVAFFWPWSSERFFFGFRPIEASPVSARRFLSARGWEVFRSELIWVWTPLLSLALLGYLVRSRFASCASH